MIKRANIRVNGIVQGVGFRPFIHKQIDEHELKGWIRNTSLGAEIELEGEESSIDSFIGELWTRSPRLSLITSVRAEKSDELAGYKDFRIIESSESEKKNTLISPDVSICDECLEELYTPGRRYRYPFINCTNCGPRFTIIRDVPYDRRQTTMGAFDMCPDCVKEYTDINDRRYHAEPTGCNICGPVLKFLGPEGEVLAEETAVSPQMSLERDPVEWARRWLLEGRIVAVKGLGGYHLAGRIDDPKIARTLRARKHRDEKPFAIMCRDVETVRRFCLVSDDEERVLSGHRRPIVLLRKKPGCGMDLSAISENGYIGVMLPYTPVHYMLFEKDLDALIMTSANLSDLPIIYKDEDAVRDLRGIADGFLVNNREIHVRCDDSLCYVFDGAEYPVRRSRGFVPYPIITGEELPGILACGAEQKASFCLSKGNYVFPSQHIGDMKNVETFENYQSQIRHFERLFDIEPEALACDLHPDYISSEYAADRARRQGIPLIRIQHHHAHMASCMADNDLAGDVIGIIWDGVGYGEDGAAWGGEFLSGGYTHYHRKGYLAYMRLPGGDLVTRELWRMGLSLLIDSGADESICGALFPGEKVRLVKSQLSLGINTPRSSGMGRLFDGVAAILGIKREASYEGQGAILLEAAATASDRELEYDIINKNGRYILNWRPMIRQIAQESASGADTSELAAAFMNTIVGAAAEMAGYIAADTALHRVVLSGGTFNNMYIMERLPDKLRRLGLKVYHHHRVSCGDEGLSLGQLMIAAALMNKDLW